MTDQYDVIIVGSGPGGGTMAWRLAQTGKRVLLLERGDYLPRERENWDTKAVFVDARYQARKPGMARTARLPSGPALFRRRQQQGLRGRVAAIAREGLRANPACGRHFSPAWPLKYDRSSRTIRPPKSSTMCTACEARIPRSRPREATRIRRFRTSRGFSSSSTGSNAKATRRSIFLWESCWTRKNGAALPHSPCIRCNAFDGYPCLTNGKADAQIICVDPALLAHPNLTLMTNSYVDRLTRTVRHGASAESR